MENVSVFDNSEFGSIRTMMVSNNPWFVGKDVATSLGYANTRDALKNHIDSEDKQIFKGSDSRLLKTSNYGITIINESGLYSLILASKLPNAKAFKRWITSEVLPSIRKTGSYSAPQTQSTLPATIEIRREQKEPKSKSMVIRVNAEAAEIIQTLCAETRKPTSQIASELIIKAFPLVQVTD